MPDFVDIPDRGSVSYSEPFGQWDESSQYAPTPGNFGPYAVSPSSFSATYMDRVAPIDPSTSQPNASRTNKLPLLQFGDWEEDRAYDEDPPTCIHYSIEWKVTVNHRTVAKDTEQDVVLAPRFYWRLFLEPKLKELIFRKYSHRNVESDDTSVVVSVTRHSQRDLTRRFEKTNIQWPAIEKQLVEWGDLFLAGKKLRLNISFNYIENSTGSTATRRMADKRGSTSATQRMLQEREQQIQEEEERTGQPSAWRLVYALMRCPGSCDSGPHCWQDPYGKKHYKLYRDELASLVRYVETGGVLQSHDDVPDWIRERIYKAERQRSAGQKGHSRSSTDPALPPINITNVLPGQVAQQAISSMSCPKSPLSRPVPSPCLDIPGLRDAAVQAYSSWQQSQVGDEGWKAEFQKACDVAINDGLDLEQIHEDRDPEYFRKRGVKWGIARRFVKDIKHWAEDNRFHLQE